MPPFTNSRHNPSSGSSRQSRLAVRSAPDERQRRKAVKPGIRLVSMVISALKGQLHCPIDQSVPEADAIRKFFVH